MQGTISVNIALVVCAASSSPTQGQLLFPEKAQSVPAEAVSDGAAH